MLNFKLGLWEVRLFIVRLWVRWWLLRERDLRRVKERGFFVFVERMEVYFRERVEVRWEMLWKECVYKVGFV